MSADHFEVDMPAREHAKTTKIPLAEWIVALAGFMLVSGAIGFMLHRGLADSSSPPDILTQVRSIERVTSGYLVTVRAFNAGRRTAARVKVQVALKSGDATVETSEMTFDYLPSRSEKHGGAFFERDPRRFEVVLRASGYEDP